MRDRDGRLMHPIFHGSRIARYASSRKRLSDLATGEPTIQQPIRGSNERRQQNGLPPNGPPDGEVCGRLNLKIFCGGVNPSGALFQIQPMILIFERV
jgi:hypothetical protein